MSDIAESTVAQCEALHDQGLSTRAIALKAGVSKTFVGNLIQRRFGKKKQQPTKLERLGISSATILQMYQERQLTCEQIGRQFGMSREPIRRLLHDCGIFQAVRGSRARERLSRRLPEGTGPQREPKDHKTHSAGYVLLYMPEHPRAQKSGYVYEHTVVWERYHNSPLPQGWVIHHLNGVKADNRPCNLVGLSRREHAQVFAAKAKRIRELEIENEKLREILQTKQLMFILGEN